MIPSEKTHSSSYYDNQLEMSSILAQHGMCFYSKEIASLESIMGCQSNLDLVSEMLSSSESSVALGKLASQEDGGQANRSSTEPAKSSIFLARYDLTCEIKPLKLRYHSLELLPSRKVR